MYGKSRMEILTSADSEVQQRSIAGAVLQLGVQAGDRVVMATSGTAAMLSAVIGLLRVGIVPVVLNSALLDQERDALVLNADPALTINDSTLDQLLQGPQVDLAEFPLARPMHYTSGTSGTPKGVWSGVLGESDAQSLFNDEADLWGLSSDDLHLVCSPLHHSAPIRFSAGTLLRGGSVLIPGKFDAQQIVQVIQAYSPTAAFMVPSHLQRLSAIGALDVQEGADFSSFRVLAHAGEPCPAPLKMATIQAFPKDSVWEFYGSTEGQFTACPSTEWQERPGTVGRARAGRELSVDPDGTIWCAAPEFAHFSYWRDAERTELAWRKKIQQPSQPSQPNQPNQPSAFSVGDLGHLDIDGFLWLDGRRDDLIISGGVNVYPAEVESVLAYAPGVEQVAVFGLSDEQWGQKVCAAVVGTASAQAIHSFATSQMAAYKCPKAIYFFDELPHTSTGKIQRKKIATSLGLE
ncbi:MAG: AMP-binding protein [Microthrixaceae bacterium]